MDSNPVVSVASLAAIRITRITESFVHHLENIILKRELEWLKQGDIFHHGTANPRENRNKTKLLLVLKCSLEDFIVEGHKCLKCQFLPTEKVFNIFDNIDDLGKSLDHDTKLALVHVAGYVSWHDDENIDDTMFYYEKFGSFTSYLNREKPDIPGDFACH